MNPTSLSKRDVPEFSFSLVRSEDESDIRFRLGIFERWMESEKVSIVGADLKLFRDDMLALDYAPRTVQAMLSTVRERMRELIHNNEFIAAMKEALWRSNPKFSAADLELQIQAMLRQMKNNADPRNSRIRNKKIQDHLDQDERRLWLNDGRYEVLLDQVTDGKPELLALRDRAIVGLFLATGARNQEVCNLLVGDVHKSFQQKPALLIRAGKGDKQRLVVYGDLWERFMQPYVLPWIEFVSEADEPLFRGFWKGWQKLRPGHLVPSTINRMLEVYKFDEGDEAVHVKPHDLRRTYARMLFEEYNMSVTGIQQQMGHADQKTTIQYIGKLDVSFRTPQGHKP